MTKHRHIYVYVTKGIWPVSPHIYTPVKQEVMVDHLRGSNQTGELKNVKHDWKYTSVRFLGVPIIVAHMFWRKIFI